MNVMILAPEMDMERKVTLPYQKMSVVIKKKKQTNVIVVRKG